MARFSFEFYFVVQGPGMLLVGAVDTSPITTRWSFTLLDGELSEVSCSRCLNADTSEVSL